ncbi:MULTISPECIES: hypothetical protein [unclassified Pseudomonas]|uniref:HNH endonuclease n=1 Tax=unclassified Pseudomonas TaxID=196821 RepID=UPI002AC9238F|nr:MULTISPECIES: hypothetical protein [unclassified Pseudomonas]MEB0046842.1 hypothetical protein [Pseudomonas sp. Dout3]MEB0099467.1 hypothetical protein [Pseudomonas sp. DC1.2]WPX59648.1 hypothetical protein RHM68_03040 [Pseudomonas sp. DC1.2]
MTLMTIPNHSCLYCGSSGPFSDEHVISAGMGGDDNRFVLKNCVCRTCNTEIFSPLELEVLRSSPLAIGRIFMQPLGRKRGKSTNLPKLQAKSKAMISESGRPLDFEFGQNAKPILIPQLTMVGQSAFESNSDTGLELQEFVEVARRLFNEPIVLIRKLVGEVKSTFELARWVWADGEYVEAGEAEIAAKPPVGGIWFERMEQSGDEPSPYLARLFQTGTKSVGLRVACEMAPQAALIFFRKAIEQIDFSTTVESLITNPVVSVGMTISVGMMDRVMTKIGLNILAFVAGPDYLRHPAFDEIKKSVMTGRPELQMTPGDEAGQVKFIFDRVPAGHHVFFISGMYLPDGKYALGMTMKLYGSSGSFVKLGIDVPEPPVPMPIIFTADYTTHSVKQWSLIEFSKLLRDCWQEGSSLR